LWVITSKHHLLKFVFLLLVRFNLGVPNWSVIYINTAPSTSFLAPLPGIEEEEAPISTTRSHVNLAPSNRNQSEGDFFYKAGHILNFYCANEIKFDVLMDWRLALVFPLCGMHVIFSEFEVSIEGGFGGMAEAHNSPLHECTTSYTDRRWHIACAKIDITIF
jgi:hypothetical protein